MSVRLDLQLPLHLLLPLYLPLDLHTHHIAAQSGPALNFVPYPAVVLQINNMCTSVDALPHSDHGLVW